MIKVQFDSFNSDMLRLTAKRLDSVAWEVSGVEYESRVGFFVAVLVDGESSQVATFWSRTRKKAPF